MHVYYKLEIQDATSTKKEYQLQIIQLQNATKWVLVLTYLSKIKKTVATKWQLDMAQAQFATKWQPTPI